MKTEEDKEQGLLNVNINYIKAAQHISAAVHFLHLLSKDLEEAALRKKISTIKKNPHESDSGAWP